MCVDAYRTQGTEKTRVNEWPPAQPVYPLSTDFSLTLVALVGDSMRQRPVPSNSIDETRVISIDETWARVVIGFINRVIASNKYDDDRAVSNVTIVTN